jgi:hypothetical protein
MTMILFLLEWVVFVVLVVFVVFVVSDISTLPANRLATLATCSPSSRVGTTMSAWTAERVGSMAAKHGSKKAKVLPLPVCACTTTSVAPSIKMASRVRSCTSVGWRHPLARHLSSNHGGRWPAYRWWNDEVDEVDEGELGSVLVLAVLAVVPLPPEGALSETDSTEKERAHRLQHEHGRVKMRHQAHVLLDRIILSHPWRVDASLLGMLECLV